MKFLIVNTDYPAYIKNFYVQYPRLESRSYKEQLKARIESFFGLADFYSSNLKKLGHEAWDVFFNHQPLQSAWAREHGVRTTKRWLNEVLMAQVREYQPDVFYNLAMDGISNDFIREVRPEVKLVVGQHASPLPAETGYDAYDLVVSSLPSLVDYFNSEGVPSELLKLGFEPRVLEKLQDNNKAFSVSFVGSLSLAHRSRVDWLKYLCQQTDFQIWGYGLEGWSNNSLIRQHYRGEAWGIKMYQILRDSKIGLNHHIDMAGSYANNMRLYETAGVGTLLITDGKKNLDEIFEIGKEVVAYQGPEECAELIRYYLAHDKEREAIAKAGQKRTLKEHTYYQRMQELVAIIQKYL